MGKKTYTMALGGICLALTEVVLFFASVVPGVELTLYAISSVFIGVMILEAGLKSGAILYVASVVLGLLLIPAKTALIPFIFFFGLYGIIKYLSEKLKRAPFQLAVKLASFFIIFGVGYVFFRGLFFGNISLPDYSMWILVAGGALMFLLYDFIYTLALNLYLHRIKRKGKLKAFKLYHDDDDDK